MWIPGHLPLDCTASLHTSSRSPKVCQSVPSRPEVPTHLDVSSTPQPHKRKPARGTAPHWRREPTRMKETKPATPMWGGALGRFCLVWLWCGGHIEVGRYIGSRRNGVPRPWVTLNLCVMRRYNLGERDLVSTSPHLYCTDPARVRVYFEVLGDLDRYLSDVCSICTAFTTVERNG